MSQNNRKFIVIELTDEELLFKMSETLPLEEAGAMLYGCLDYLTNLLGVLDSADKTMLQ